MNASVFSRKLSFNLYHCAGFVTAMLLIMASAPALADWPNTNATKWVQAPNATPSGYDVQMSPPLILASDFLCTNPAPITDIHIWASYLNDQSPGTNASFTVSIWSNLAGAGSTNFGHPGSRLWTQAFGPGWYQVRLWQTNVTENFWNPDQGFSGIIGADHAIWQYNFYPTNPFVQQGTSEDPKLYWLSVNATTIDVTNIGWKTTANHWNSDSVYADLDSPGGTNLLSGWQRLFDPNVFPANDGSSLDLSFALTTSTNVQTSSTNRFIDKWLQVPDTSPSGFDVSAPDLADDFQCNASGPITQVRIWGSWLNDNIPTTPPDFQLLIWTDTPAQGTNYSHPDTAWCLNLDYPPGSYAYFLYATNVNEQFYEINPVSGTNAIIGSDHAIYEYVFDIPTNPPCIQTSGNIYWLGVNALNYGEPQYKFGWKTCPTNWNDDAVWDPEINHIVGFPIPWRDLRRPPSFSNSLDMAFEILTRLPSTGDTNKWLQIPDTSTNGIDVKVSDPQILADDFRCTSTGPITQVRIWGSWRFDQQPTNINLPCFWLDIWDDVPATNGNFSHPGNRLCHNQFYYTQYSFFRYTNQVNEQFFDPDLQFNVGSDTEIWEYVFNLPTNNPCIQTNGNIYWLAITADCIDQNQFLFGWKTCPTNFNDDAVYADAPYGSQPAFWNELRRPPLFTNSLDLAFEILTTPTGPPSATVTNYKWLQVPDTSTNGLDVRATDPKILADDFRCTATGPITQVRLWGSWLNDQVPPDPACICLGLWTDIPRNGNNYSRPGNLICNYCFQTNQYFFFPYTNGVFEQFYDPSLPGTNGLIGTDTRIWEYVFNLPTNSCWRQTNGNTYWLSIDAGCFDQSQFRFGWKTCTTNWNDDAVIGDIPGFNWIDLHRPDTTNSIDVAFEIITASNNAPCPPPAIICQPDKAVQCGSGWNLDPPFVVTNCCGTNYTLTSSAYTNRSCPRIATITWIVTDCYGNSSFCSQAVTLIDNDPPIVTCPTNKTVQCGSGWTFDAPTAFDQCCGTNVSIVVLNTFTNGGTCSSLITRFWQIADCCSNLANCSQTVTVVDTTPPNLACAPNKLVQCTNMWTFDPPGAFDLCCSNNVNVTVLGTLTNGTPCSGMAFTRTWQAVDCCSNAATCSQVVTQAAITAPVVACATNKTVGCGSSWTFDPPSVTGTCCTNLTITVLSTVTNTGCCFTNFITRIWQATDCCTNSVTCTQTVSVIYTNPPVITCASNKTVVCGTAWDFDPPTVVDACCGTNFSVIESTETNGCSVTRTWVASGNCGPNGCGSNVCLAVASFCRQTVTLIDTNKPTIVCSTNVVVLTCSTNIAVTWSLSATDTCSSVTVTSSPASGTLFNRDSTNAVTAVATDGCGNTNSCSFLVIVRRPALNIAIGGTPGTIVISWADGGTLQETTNLLSSFISLPLATSPYTNTVLGSQKFYRLKCP